MQHTRTAAGAVIAATAVLSLTACGFGGGSDTGNGGSGDGGEGGSTTLNLVVPSYSDGTKANWETVIDGFEAENDNISVNLEVVSWDNLDSVMNTKVSGNQAPDIYNGGPFQSYVADDLLYSAEEVLSPATLSDFQDSFVANASIDGTQYGLPMIASARALFVNTDLLAQAGVDKAPTTWDEMKTAAVKISELGNGIAGYGLPLGSEEAQAEAAVWFYGGGGSFGDAEKLTIDTPENVAAAQFVRDLIDAGGTQADAASSDRSPLMEVFVQGKIGMQIGLPPTVGQIAEKNPDLKYEIAPIPTKDGSAFTLGVADHLVAFKNDGKKQEAITAFFDYLFSPDVYTTWVTAESFLPTTKSGSEAMGSDEAIAPFIEALPAAEFYPSANPNWAAADAAFKQNFGLIATQDPASVLKTIQSEADAG